MPRKNSANFSNKIVLIGCVLTFCAVGVTLGYILMYRPVKAPSAQNVLLSEKGINPNQVAIRAVDSQSTWKANNVAYTLKKVYLTPDIADVGHWRDNFKIGTKNQFVVVELDVKDDRKGGERRKVDTTSFLRLKVNDSQEAPVEEDYLALRPQENGKIFQIFVVEKNVQTMTLLSGPLAKPQLTQLDFFGPTATTLNGVFLHRSGVSSTYDLSENQGN